jgi:bifunctional non-homologous end joining protein LigD
MNGVRKMVHKVTEETFMTNKKGKRVAYLSTYDISLKNFKSISLDGEEIGERLFAFDLLEYEGQSLRSLGYAARYDTLKNINFTSSSNITVIELAIGYKQKKAMYDRLKAEGKEGIVFKKLDASFTAGKGHGCMFKCKFYSTVSVRVCKGREGKRSIGMELFDGTQWIPVGNCTLPSDKTVVPSVGSISEIRYLYAYKGGSLYQPTYLGPRDDVDADECLINQLKYKPDEEVFNSCNNLTKSKEIC